MKSDLQLRTFSEQCHTTGQWKTRRSSSSNPFVRGLWDFMSFKRAGISQLAGFCKPQSRILDLGCGNGSYSLWFLGKNASTVIACDWSFTALKMIPHTSKKSIFPVCADARYLPFKEEVFDGTMSIDMLGHVPHTEKVVDEIMRCGKPAGKFFLHSECADYKNRWPDSMLIRRLKSDTPADYDGHINLHTAAELYQIFSPRISMTDFFSPAGYLGWLIGYPEKYRPAFIKARLYMLAAITLIFVITKKMPVIGILLRLFNALTNRLELSLGLGGGGSCFAAGTLGPNTQQQPTSNRRGKNA
jgi:SAM-dependent methyltransferase